MFQPPSQPSNPASPVRFCPQSGDSPSPSPRDVCRSSDFQVTHGDRPSRLRSRHNVFSDMPADPMMSDGSKSPGAETGRGNRAGWSAGDTGSPAFFTCKDHFWHPSGATNHLKNILATEAQQAHAPKCDQVRIPVESCPKTEAKESQKASASTLRDRPVSN